MRDFSWANPYVSFRVAVPVASPSGSITNVQVPPRSSESGPNVSVGSRPRLVDVEGVDEGAVRPARASGVRFRRDPLAARRRERDLRQLPRRFVLSVTDPPPLLGVTDAVRSLKEQKLSFVCRSSGRGSRA
jgi:hypothetical protein